MGKADFLELGTWNSVCFQCGFKFKANQLKRHWQGYYVCSRCWEPRQPQDFVRSVQDVQTPPWTQARPGWKYGGTYRVTSTGTPNAYVVTLPAFTPITAYTDGDVYNFTPNFTNTGATTLEVYIGATSLGALPVKRNGSALAGGEIVIAVESVVVVAGTGTYFNLQ